MPFQLGPGFLRRAPKGWTPARAFPVEHRVTPAGNDSNSDVDTSVSVEVHWRIEPEGGVPYEFSEQRRMPTWVQTGGVVGTGNRWYKLRLRPTFGLMRSVGVPGMVDPQDAASLWVDWDAAYAEHEPAWDQHARVDREFQRRKGKLDHVMDRISSPFSGAIRPEEQHLVDEAQAEEARRTAELEARYAASAQQQMAAMGFGPVAPEERARSDARTARETELGRTGRPASATVVASADTGRTLANIPVIELTLDVDDGGTIRRVVYEHVWGPRHAKRYKAGKRIDVKVDPSDPDTVALAS